MSSYHCIRHHYHFISRKFTVNTFILVRVPFFAPFQELDDVHFECNGKVPISYIKLGFCVFYYKKCLFLVCVRVRVFIGVSFNKKRANGQFYHHYSAKVFVVRTPFDD